MQIQDDDEKLRSVARSRGTLTETRSVGRLDSQPYTEAYEPRSRGARYRPPGLGRACRGRPPALDGRSGHSAVAVSSSTVAAPWPADFQPRRGLRRPIAKIRSHHHREPADRNTPRRCSRGSTRSDEQEVCDLAGAEQTTRRTWLAAEASLIELVVGGGRAVGLRLDDDARWK